MAESAGGGGGGVRQGWATGCDGKQSRRAGF